MNSALFDKHFRRFREFSAPASGPRVREGWTDPCAPPRASRRTRIATALLGLAALVGGLLMPTAAQAAPGDYTIAIDTPVTVSVNATFSVAVSITCPEAPCTGIRVTQTLPDELRFVDAPTGADQVVAAVSGTPSLDAYGAAIAFDLNPITVSGVTMFSAVLQNDNRATTTVGPDSSWTIEVESGGQTATGTTRPTGSIVPTLSKTQQTIPDSDNRRVTYEFTPSFSYPHVGRWAFRNVRIWDVLPANAVVDRAASLSGTIGGTWERTGTADNGGQIWTLQATGTAVLGQHANTATATATATAVDGSGAELTEQPAPRHGCVLVHRRGARDGWRGRRRRRRLRR